jgi:2-succinyl-5-enolpyruvyl-6-hydroxy-3-cyclohexene-1-carboxylate synthase
MALSSDKKVVSHLVEQCVAHGLKHIVCSPGSRNAPLVIAFDEHPDVECYVVHDERSAAFVALGMMQQLSAPVAVVCTSGSAVANYYPAVVEAYYQCLPLVVITADRPAAWIDQGDGQTIKQHEVFGAHVRYNANFSDSQDNSEGLWMLEREVSIAFSEGNGAWKGPIHFNVGLSEPLYGTVEKAEITPRLIHLEKGKFTFSTEQSGWMKQKLEVSRILVLCGQLEPDPLLNKLLLEFGEHPSVAIVVENTSNLEGKQFVNCIDRTLNAISEDEIEAFRPDVLITLGGAIVSKRIKAFFRKNKPHMHWKVGFEFPYMDTFQCLTHSFQASPKDFLEQLNLLRLNLNKFNFGSKWKQRDFEVQGRMPAFLANAPYSDLKVFDELLDYLPESCHLHMANSSVVRYCQLFDPIRGVRYWSNRGTSGIDGSSSTAVGAAWIAKKDLHVLITGDVSFFYDSNALWNKYLGANLRIILINNSGGGIFRIIPGPDKSPQLETYFEAQHKQQAKEICQAFHVDYLSIANLNDMDNVMREFYTYKEDGRPKLLEIFTPTEENSGVLTSFFEHTRGF